MIHSPVRLMVYSALVTAGTLLGGMVAGVVAGSLIHGSLPGHFSEGARVGLAALPALAGMFGGGAAWGMAMGRLIGHQASQRLALAGGLGFGVTALIVALVLSGLEVALVQRGLAGDLPIHVIFTLLFVPAAGLVAGSGAWALGWALHDRVLAGRLAWMCAVAGALTFLLVNLLMDALGWRVGAPGAAERATMVTVMSLGSVAAALAGGAIIGAVLARTTVSSRVLAV